MRPFAAVSKGTWMISVVVGDPDVNDVPQFQN